jgi:hypothetical protein
VLLLVTTRNTVVNGRSLARHDPALGRAAVGHMNTDDVSRRNQPVLLQKRRK